MYLDGEVMVFLCERRESLLCLISFSRSEEKLSVKVLVFSKRSETRGMNDRKGKGLIELMCLNRLC